MMSGLVANAAPEKNSPATLEVEREQRERFMMSAGVMGEAKHIRPENRIG
jgi:hypothetical protein